MNTMAITLFGSLIVSLSIPSIFALRYKERIHSSMDRNDKWSFKDWAGPLTAMVASVSLIFTLIHNNAAVTGISIICGATIVLMPTAYQAISPSKGRVWIFLCLSALTLCAVSTQFVTAAFSSDDDLITGVPATYLRVFRVLMGLATVVAYIYYWRSTPQTIEKQSYAPAAKEPSTSQTQDAGAVQNYSQAVAA